MEATQSRSGSPHLSTIAKKVIMALTGLVWIGFVFFHMYGNLKVFMGLQYFNHYAEDLRSLGAPVFSNLHLLTLLRIVVVISLILHVWAAYSLTRQAQKARSTKYEVKRTVAANYASITMRYGGTVILLFVLFHLADLTWGVEALSPDFDRLNPYLNVISSFQNPFVVLFYLLALTALGFHLYHGTWSMLQTLGILSQKYDTFVRICGLLLALVITLGFAAVPLAVLFGVLQ
jgi:succinate dehydrogenase / fumarate reductase cytochrome b subunit